MSPLLLAVLLSLVSAVAYAAGAIVQERVAATTPARTYAPLQNAVWWCAVALNGIGALLHVIALAYGPLSVVQPLGALTIVFALPMAAVFVRRRAGAAAWRGALVATVGLAGLLMLSGDAGNSASSSLGTGQRGVLAAVTFGTIAMVFLAAQTINRPVLRSVLLATAAGVAFGIGSVFTKTVAMDWDWSAPWAQWSSLIAVAVLATGGLLLSQASYRGAGLAAPLATVTVVNPVVATAVGLTMFGESFRGGVFGTVLALGFGALAATGLVLLTSERLAASRRRAGAGEAESLEGFPTESGTTEESGEADGRAHGGPAADERLGEGAYGSYGPAAGSGPGRHRFRTACHRTRRASHGSPADHHRTRRAAKAAPAAPVEQRAGAPRAPRSERDAAGPEVGHGVDVGSVPRPGSDLEVKMRP
ncbi:DMT family transporter [Streptomyces qinzhouensis]|uniref:DMT family transporter n=1 Tax=Streptomyces qinzhouensis TaxID=2599401 RepID=UPI001FE3DC11|nr:DMT family transporter [Streptomyces qinzhouensis]